MMGALQCGKGSSNGTLQRIGTQARAPHATTHQDQALPVKSSTHVSICCEGWGLQTLPVTTCRSPVHSPPQQGVAKPCRASRCAHGSLQPRRAPAPQQFRSPSGRLRSHAAAPLQGSKGEGRGMGRCGAGGASTRGSSSVIANMEQPEQPPCPEMAVSCLGRAGAGAPSSRRAPRPRAAAHAPAPCRVSQ